MIEVVASFTNNIIGLFELNTDGTVLYSRSRVNGQLSSPANEIVGRDFFADVARFQNRNELRRHFHTFLRSSRSVDNFVFDCIYADEVVSTKINMTRACERDSDRTDGIVIIDIKRTAT